MPTTSNFGWTTPADTDLVKDGASAIRTLGNGVDTSMAQLKGGTTGQILSKTSNTDMAFTWINNDQGDITAVTAGTGISGGGTSGAVTITNSMATEITAAGDIIIGTGSGTFDNLPIGTTGQVLTADTTVSPYKVKWASAAGPTFVGCLVYPAANIDVSNATNTTLDFGSEVIDTDGFHSTTTNTSRITVPTGKGGKYYIFGTTGMNNSSTNGRREIIFLKNGVEYARQIGEIQGSNLTYYFSYWATIMDLVATDYVQMQVYQNSGGTRSYYGDNSVTKATQFGAIYLGA